MSIKNDAKRQKEQTFIEKARRAQIVACAIETIAEIGYAQASIGQIAKRANISKGVISYHFSSKEELFAQVVVEYYTLCQSVISPQFPENMPAIDMLQHYISTNVKFVDEHRQHVFAVVEIASNERTADGKLRFVADHDGAIFEPIKHILRTGAQQGVFRELSAMAATVTATTIRHAIDGFSLELMRNTSLDVEAYSSELIALFTRSVHI